MTTPALRARIAWVLTTVALLASTQATPTAAQEATSTPEGPDFETNGALPWEEPPGARPYIVWEVGDGDTIQVIEESQRNDPDPWWEPVRIIGIDTPEKDGPYTDEECYGQEASAFTASLLPKGTMVYLQVDTDPDIDDDREFVEDGLELDDNDRWLMHAYLRDGEDYYLLSEIITLGGYAEVPGYRGNTYFVDVLDEAEQITREDDRGMWGACDV